MSLAMNADVVREVLGDLVAAGSYNSPLQVHFDKGDIQGYVDTQSENGPWEVVLIGNSATHSASTPDALREIINSL